MWLKKCEGIGDCRYKLCTIFFNLGHPVLDGYVLAFNATAKTRDNSRSGIRLRLGFDGVWWYFARLVRSCCAWQSQLPYYLHFCLPRFVLVLIMSFHWFIGGVSALFNQYFDFILDWMVVVRMRVECV